MKITEKTRNLKEIEGAGKKTRKTRAGRARPTLYTQALTPDRPPQAEITGKVRAAVACGLFSLAWILTCVQLWASSVSQTKQMLAAIELLPVSVTHYTYIHHLGQLTMRHLVVERSSVDPTLATLDEIGPPTPLTRATEALIMYCAKPTLLLGRLHLTLLGQDDPGK